jgi:hypothetical protein
MKADLRISIKDFHRNKNLKIQLVHVPFSASRQFWVRMNGVAAVFDPCVGALILIFGDSLSAISCFCGVCQGYLFQTVPCALALYI